MKGKIYALGVAGMIGIFGAFLYIQNYNTKSYQPKNYDVVNSQLSAAKFSHQFRQMMLADEKGEVHMDEYYKMLRNAERNLSAKAPADMIFWQDMGPNFVGGRTRALIQDNREGRGSTFYAGGVAGGVWISYNAGEEWFEFSGDDNISGKLGSMFIGDIAQTADGKLWVGTGPGHDDLNQLKQSSSGFPGDGLFRLDDEANVSYTRVIGPDNRYDNDNWREINRVKTHPTDANKIYVGTGGGFFVSADAQASEPTFFNAIEVAPGITLNGPINDIEVSNDGSIIYVASGSNIYKLRDNGGSDIELTSTIPLPAGNGNPARIALGLAPSNNDVIYAAVGVAGQAPCTYGIFQSRDAGETWTNIGPGGGSFDPYVSLGCQSNWDNDIDVFPNDPGKIIVGGVTLWGWTESTTAPGTGGWSRIALNFGGSLADTNYVHSDVHRVLIIDSLTVYIASDGGIGKSLDGGRTWGQNNNGYRTYQPYAVDAAFGAALDSSFQFGSEQVMGGSQDNGTQLIGVNSLRPDDAFQLSGGDGYDCNFSNLSNQAFTTVYYGALQRVSFGRGSSTFYDDELQAYCGGGGINGCGPFYTSIDYWEDAYYPYTYDSIQINAKGNGYQRGDTIYYDSQIGNGFFAPPMFYVAPRDVPAGDSINVPDYAQSRLALGTGGEVYVCRDAANLNTVDFRWDCVANGNASQTFPNAVNGTVFRIAFAKDGNQLYFSTTNGRLYRIDNLMQGKDSASTDVRSPQSVLTCTQIASFSGTITHIAINPNDAEEVLVTLQGTSAGNKIFRVSDAGSALSNAANVRAIDGDLPERMPLYSAVIADHDDNTVVVGTELGVYITDEANSPNPTWFYGWGMPRVPVYDMVQQTQRWYLGENGPQETENLHYRKIYVGTHGRGFWKSESLVGIDEELEDEIAAADASVISRMKVYPNPMSDVGILEVDLIESQRVRIDIFDLSGKVVQSISRDNMRAGLNKIEINTNDLNNGTYIASLQAGDEMKVSKFIVLK